MNRARLAAGQTASNLLYLALNYYRARSTMGTGRVHRKRLNWMTDLDCSIRNPPPRLRLHARPPRFLTHMCARVDESTIPGIMSLPTEAIFLLSFSLVKIFNGWLFRFRSPTGKLDIFDRHALQSFHCMILCNTIWYDTVRLIVCKSRSVRDKRD